MLTEKDLKELVKSGKVKTSDIDFDFDEQDDLQKQKLELQKQKLELEKEKLKIQKQKITPQDKKRINVGIIVTGVWCCLLFVVYIILWAKIVK